MKQSSIFAVWGIFYIICAGLGFIPEPEGSVRIFLLVISLMFFVPPAILVWDARAQGDKKTLRTIRLLAVASLTLTLVLVIANILTAFSSEAVGMFFHVLLVLASAPMLCSSYWVLSLFLWAVLLFATLVKKQ